MIFYSFRNPLLLGVPLFVKLWLIAGVTNLCFAANPDLEKKSVPTPLFGRMIEETHQPAKHDPNIQINLLDQVDIGSIGLLDVTAGGLPTNLWDGASLHIVMEMLEQLPVASPSGAVHELMRLLLLSRAAAPRPAPKQKEITDPTYYTALRIKRLIDIGLLVEAYRLSQLLPDNLEQPALDRLRIQAGLLAGQIKQACQDASRSAELYGDSFFIQTRIYCKTREGDAEPALMGLSILRETEKIDPLFSGLIEQMLGAEPPIIENPSEISPLLMRLFLDAGRAYPVEIGKNASFGYRRLYIDNPINDQKSRLEAAEMLVATGVLAADKLRLLYYEASSAHVITTETENSTASPVNNQERQKPDNFDSSIGLMEKSASSRAALFKIIRDTAPTRRPEIAAKLKNLFDRAQNESSYRALLMASEPFALRLQPDANLAWFADNMARIHLLIGKRNRMAIPWLVYAANPTSGLSFSLEVEGKEIPAWILGRIAGVTKAENWSPMRLEQWVAQQKKINSPHSLQRLSLALTLLRAFGDPVQWDSRPLREILTERANGNNLSPQMIALRSGSAAVRKQIGLTILFSILALGEEEIGSVDIYVLDQVLRSLNYIGLEAVARRMALEVAIAPIF